MRICDTTPIDEMVKRTTVIKSVITGAEIQVKGITGQKALAVELKMRLNAANQLTRRFLDELCKEAVKRLSLAVDVDEEVELGKEPRLLFSGICLAKRGIDDRTIMAYAIPLDSLALLAALSGYSCKQDVLNLCPDLSN